MGGMAETDCIRADTDYEQHGNFKLDTTTLPQKMAMGTKDSKFEIYKITVGLLYLFLGTLYIHMTHGNVDTELLPNRGENG